MAKDINVSITAGKEEEGLFYDLVTVKEKLDNLPHIPGEDDDVTFKSVTVKEGVSAPNGTVTAHDVFADNGTISGHDVYNTSQDYPNFEPDQCVTRNWINWHLGELNYARQGGTNRFTAHNTFTETTTFNDAEFETIEVAGNATLNGDVSIHKATLQESQAVASLRSNDLVTKGTTDSLISRLSVDYDSDDKLLLLKYNGTVISEQDARPFIKDGMVDRVYLDGIGNLVISFNTDAGKESISIPLDQIFNPNNYYTKTDVNNIVDGIYGEGPCDDYDTLTKCQAGFNDVYAHKTDFQDAGNTALNNVSAGVGAKAFTRADVSINYSLMYIDRAGMPSQTGGSSAFSGNGLLFKDVNSSTTRQYVGSAYAAENVYCCTYNNSNSVLRRIKAAMSEAWDGEDLGFRSSQTIKNGPNTYNLGLPSIRFVGSAQELQKALGSRAVKYIYIVAPYISWDDIIDIATNRDSSGNISTREVCIVGMSALGYKPYLRGQLCCQNIRLCMVNLDYSPDIVNVDGTEEIHLYDCLESSSKYDTNNTCSIFHHNCTFESRFVDATQKPMSGLTGNMQTLYDCTIHYDTESPIGCFGGMRVNPNSRGNTFLLPTHKNAESGEVLGIPEYSLIRNDNKVVCSDGVREAPNGITLGQPVMVGDYIANSLYKQAGKILYLGGDTISSRISEVFDGDCPLLFKLIEQRQTINLQTGLENLNLTIEGPSLHGNGGMADIGFGDGNRGINIVNRKTDDDDEYTEGKVNLRLENLDVRGTVQVVSGSEGKVVIKNCHFSMPEQTSFFKFASSYVMTVEFYNCVFEVNGLGALIPFSTALNWFTDPGYVYLKFVNCTIVDDRSLATPTPLFDEKMIVSNSHGNTFISCMPEGSLVFATQDEQDEFIRTNTLKYLG